MYASLRNFAEESVKCAKLVSITISGGQLFPCIHSQVRAIHDGRQLLGICLWVTCHDLPYFYRMDVGVVHASHNFCHNEVGSANALRRLRKISTVSD